MGLSCNIFSGYLSYNIFMVSSLISYRYFPAFPFIISFSIGNFSYNIFFYGIFSMIFFYGGTLPCNIFFQGIFIDIFFPVYPYLWYLTYPYNYYIPYVFQFFITQFFQFINCKPCFLFCHFHSFLFSCKLKKLFITLHFK